MILIDGYIDPVGTGIGFMVPSITVEGTNARYIQKWCGNLSNIVLEAFDIDEVESFSALQEKYKIDKNIENGVLKLDAQYYVFRFEDTILIGKKSEISSSLKSILSYLEAYPVQYFDVVRFLEIKKKIR